ncbi:hypothetical protein SISSUDRAFT_1037631 [Sistotremastrum suecicum HHB10207 ss-3]|uniref:Fatty acid desaturase domain-containing protein n=1 Tax=Sistotremastrum suecicum HHB10207 ss-3 TaxID=1314776 RepID=A0A165XVZ7_9AGAM|nr:hypothetical protein SISSUDRAFT_1037631 [Sistotremastrum suecicum HHB10207 ss-3]
MPTENSCVTTSKLTATGRSMAELKAVIPARCFKRNLRTSVMYLMRNVSISAGAFCIALSLDHFLRGPSALSYLSILWANIFRWTSWIFYWWFQGLMFVNFWAYGHECTHNALSPFRRVDDTIGTPYYSWQMSHVIHHSHRGHAEKDVSFVPPTRSDLKIPRHEDTMEYSDFFEDAPFFTLGKLILRQQIGYLAFLIDLRTTSPKTESLVCHFLPSSTMFRHRYKDVVLSDMGILVMGGLLFYATQSFGIIWLIKTYGIPWVALNNWIVLITYLHHTAPEIPYYRGKAWNFQRGALSTVDRNPLGRLGQCFFLDAGHFHVVHHLFPQIPWYHLEEATNHLKAFIGDYYVYSDEPILKALWRSFTECQFVEDEGEVLFYRNAKGKARAKDQ